MSLRSEIIRILNELLSTSKKITELPTAGAITGAELIEVVQDGENRKTTSSSFGGGASGTVTSFSSGDLSPLFTASVANPTTTPALSFTAVAQTANIVYAGPTGGGAAVPTFRALVAADIPDLSGVYQPLSADLTAIAALGFVSTSFLKKTGAGTWALDTATYITTGSAWLLASGGALAGTNTLTGVFAVYISQGTLGVGHSSQTSSARFDSKGSGTGSTTFSIYGRNSSDARTIAARDDGALIFGSSSNGLISRTSDGSSVNVAGNSFLLLGDAENSGNVSGWNIRSGSVANSSGTKGLITTFTNFAPSSGTATWRDFSITSTYNQTSTASGAITIFNIVPTLTSVLGNLTAFLYDPTITSVTGIHYGIILDAPCLNSFNAGVTPTNAFVSIGAGTTALAPLKLISGTNLTTPVNGCFEYNGTNLFFTRTGAARENIICASAVNVVSPTAPNRTITINIDGTTYYLHAKTTND